MVWSSRGQNKSSNDRLTINGKVYVLSRPLLRWHCTQIAITPSALYVGNREVILRGLTTEEESLPDEDSSPSIVLGNFTGELFDVRLYAGSLTYIEIIEVGRRCATIDNPRILQLNNDFDTAFLRGGCDPDIDPVPTNGKQTYASGAFCTHWTAAENDKDNTDLWLDVPIGDIDVEHYFQEAKMQSYAWERWYFENDMIGFNQLPYRSAAIDEVPRHSAKVFNNPCRYPHQHNWGWLYPFYGGAIPKWESSSEDSLQQPQSVFDLRYLHYNRGYDGYGFVVHEAWHGF
mmetsp:Transcript_29905/g.44215  ORF Transcript_29905/g.44215 Transcript_29905/m.44215 type:complete len:288 (-) Transcript_29905:738-1601(-)